MNNRARRPVQISRKILCWYCSDMEHLLVFPQRLFREVSNPARDFIFENGDPGRRCLTHTRLGAIKRQDKERGRPTWRSPNSTFQPNLTLATGFAALRSWIRKTVAFWAVSTSRIVISSSTAASSALIATVVHFFRRCVFLLGRH